MITKNFKISFTAGQATVFKVIVEQIIICPARKEDNTTLARYVVAEWYRRNAGRFVFLPERLRFTFSPAQAYALNMLLQINEFDCDAAKLARSIVGLIDPKI
ncbi:MAG: hypothetical protein LBU42_00740 [Prevotellaceae bacterium]|jgi:hypothetical protein|nr:hypothetical protein [Prevotellaceae bacterium]